MTVVVVYGADLNNAEERSLLYLKHKLALPVETVGRSMCLKSSSNSNCGGLNVNWPP